MRVPRAVALNVRARCARRAGQADKRRGLTFQGGDQRVWRVGGDGEGGAVGREGLACSGGVREGLV